MSDLRRPANADDIPDLPPQSSAQSVRKTTIPMPDVIRRLFSLFPLHVWPAAQASEAWSRTSSEPLTQPILYITPPSQHTQEKNAWASADPVCLRWQMEFLFRDVPVHCEPTFDAYWSPEHSTPFALFPATSGSTHNDQLVSATGLQRYLDHHYPLSRAELGEKSVWPHGEQDEVFLWQNMLETRVMAGVILACIRAGMYTPPPIYTSFLRRHLASFFPGETSPEQAAFARLARISSAGASPSSLAAVYGRDYLADVRNPLTLVPGYSVDWVGFLSGTQTSSTDRDAEEVEHVPVQLGIDQETIKRDAADALDAVAVRLASSVDASTGDGWMLGAHRATSLDCLLFAALHTIQVLPPNEVRPLLAVMERHQHLSAYYRRLHAYLP